MEDNVIFHLLF